MGKVEIEVPDGILRFLKDVAAFTGSPSKVEEYARELFIQGFYADLDNFLSNNPFQDSETLEKKYGLEKLKAKEDC